jgi:hypothetical protein
MTDAGDNVASVYLPFLLARFLRNTISLWSSVIIEYWVRARCRFFSDAVRWSVST